MSISYFSDPSQGGDGRFIRKTSDGIIFPALAGEVLFVGDYDDVYYYDGVQVLERPTMPLSGLIDSTPIVDFTELYIPPGGTLQIDNIPVGAVVDYPMGSVVIDALDTSITWDSVTAGEYYLNITLFPFIDIKLKVFFEE